MALSVNRPLMRPPVAPASAFAQKSAVSKVATGWKETIEDLPSEAVDKLQRTAYAIAHPIDTVEKKWEAVKADPKKALLPLGMMAGGVVLTAVSPGLMRAVGIAMTASLVVIPTYRFAKSASEDELLQIADGTSKQLVDTAASYAASWAAGKVIRYSLGKLQESRAARVDVQGRGEAAIAGGETPTFSVEGDSPGTLRVMQGDGKPLSPDQINYYFRTNEEVGDQLFAQLKENVHGYHFEELKKLDPAMDRAAFDAFLKTPEARPLRLQMVQDVRGVVHGSYLNLHGLEAPQKLSIQGMADTRKYLQDFTSTYDLADAVKGLNTGLARGVTDAAPLAIEAERYLYAERGVASPFFSKYEQSGLSADELKKVRRFADTVAPSEGGKYLTRAAALAPGNTVDGLRGAMSRQMAMDAGFILPKEGVDDKTVFSLLNDLAPEDPKTSQLLVKTANEAFRRGETDYYKIHELANRRLIAGLGVDDGTMQALEVSDTALQAAKPGLAPQAARAEQIKLLRDRLRVLPEAQRTEAVAALARGKADLLSFDQVLTGNLDGQIAKLASGNAALTGKMTAGMTIQQKANFAADVARLPEDVRKSVFAGLTGTPDQMNKTVVDRLAGLIESRFEVNVHREAGRFPWEGWGDDAHVKDWTPQGAAQLFNSLDRMAVDGQSHQAVKGTTYVFQTGAEPGPGLKPFTFDRPAPSLRHYKPGADAYKGGVMGYRTGREGDDLIVLFEAAQRMPNADEAPGVAMAEGTLIHETGHAMQLGGQKAVSPAARIAQEQRLVSEWSSLSNWRERDGSLADGYYNVDGQLRRYYKDPAVEVGIRQTVPSNYGATDSVEDFAEYTRLFYNDPAVAMELSPEKFLYMNRMAQNRYDAGQVTAIANGVGIGMAGVQAALDSLRKKILAVPGRPSAFLAG